MLASSTHDSMLYRKILNRMGWSMLFFVAIFNVCTVIPTAVYEIRTYVPLTSVGYGVLTAVYGILAALCYIAPFFLTGVFYSAITRKLRVQRPLLEVRLPREFPLMILAGMAILTAAAYINGWFCGIIGYSLPDDMTVLSETYDDPSTVIMYMSVAIAPAFAEEFLFRGVFYTNLRPFGRTQAILLSSLLFSLMHQNISQLFYTFVAGIVMALMYELTGSIWCSVFFHLFNNEMAVLSEVIRFGLVGEASLPYLAMLDAVMMVLGLIGLVWLVVFYKRQADARRQKPRSGFFGVRAGDFAAMESCDKPLPGAHVVQGALSPGMVIFTAETVANMLMVWILVASGGLS